MIRSVEGTRAGERASEATDLLWNVVLHNDRNPIIKWCGDCGGPSPT
jgi:hypothetical protein